MSPRSSTTGRSPDTGARPRSTATTELSDSPDGHLEVEAGERLEHHGLGVGQVQPELGDAVQPAAQVDQLGADPARDGEGVGSVGRREQRERRAPGRD